MPKLPTIAMALAAAACGALAHGAEPAAAAPTSAPGSASASAVDPSEAFDVARRLWEAGDFTTALPLFERALASTGSPNARLYVARCLRDLGRLPEAYEQMSRTVQDARGLAEKEDRYVATRDTAAAELALLDPKVAKLVVVVDERLAGAAITINGAPVAPDRLGQPVPVSPGKVRVVAAAPGGKPVERELDAAAGKVVTVALSADATPITTAPATTPSALGEDDAQGGGFSVVQGLGIAVAAIGVAGFVTFGVERAQANAEIDTLEQDCGPGPCTDPRYADVVDRGKTAEAISAVGLAVGIAGLLAGTAMIVFGGSSTDEAATAWLPTRDGLRVRF